MRDRVVGDVGQAPPELKASASAPAARVGGERLDVAVGALGVEHPHGKGRLSGTRHFGDAHEPVEGDIHVDVLEVGDPCAANFDGSRPRMLVRTLPWPRTGFSPWCWHRHSFRALTTQFQSAQSGPCCQGGSKSVVIGHRVLARPVTPRPRRRLTRSAATPR